jgi:hypothetical protein
VTDSMNCGMNDEITGICTSHEKASARTPVRSQTVVRSAL